MSEKYVKAYNNWKEADCLVIIGFGFGSDDEHINGMIRTLIEDNSKKVIIVKPATISKSKEEIIEEISQKLKIRNSQNIDLIFVDKDGIDNRTNKIWTESLK